ncbi:MAG: pyridoxal phosphate-dependent aminotransferase [Bacteroidales bacterium]|jgi:aspartate/methionine/tyrosine aminotransferase|nr:pyridoxal phosphate-dependent aminotransferase [Bacteroidales bacterium]
MIDYTKPKGSYISFMSNKVKTFGGINFAQGIPGFKPPIELINKLKENAEKKLHQYAPGNGNTELLNLLQQKYNKQNPFTLDNFLVLQGATEALTLLFIYFNKIMKKPFATLAFDPVYETYRHLPKIFESEFIPFSLDYDANVDFERLKSTCVSNNVKVIFLSSPGNPYGKIWSKEEINKIIEISIKYKIYIVIDAVYRELYFDEKPYIPLDKFNEYMFYVNSFSKILSITGWRIGYLIAHKKHMDAIKSIHDYTGLCAPTVLQQSIADYLKENDFGKSYISNLRNQLAFSYKYISTELIKMGFSIPETKGGYFVWAKLPDRFQDGFKFAIDIYEEQKLAVIPGEHFSENCSNYIRLNIARHQNEINQGVNKLKAFCK